MLTIPSRSPCSPRYFVIRGDTEEMADGYRERPSRVAGAVVWERGAHQAGPSLVLPDGCMDIIWTDGELIVAGPDTVAWGHGVPARGGFAGLRFAPGDAPAVLGVPAHELRDNRVPLSDLWPAPLVRRLADRVTDAPDRRSALEDVVRDRLRPPDPVVAGIVTLLSDGARVTDVAGEVDMGERRLHRLCLTAFGYGPKTLARILRLNRALHLVRGGTPYATVAAEAGYADQAHLSRDVKALTGVPLHVLIS
jgi:AraC-like DNA-binding protein